MAVASHSPCLIVPLIHHRVESPEEGRDAGIIVAGVVTDHHTHLASDIPLLKSLVDVVGYVGTAVIAAHVVEGDETRLVLAHTVDEVGSDCKVGVVVGRRPQIKPNMDLSEGTVEFILDVGLPPSEENGKMVHH